MDEARVELQKRNAISHYDRKMAADPNMPPARAIGLAAQNVGASVADVTKWLAHRT